MRRLGQYTCFMLNPRTPDGNGTPSLIVSLENTKYLQLEQHAIGFSIEGRGLFNKDEEAEVAKMEAVVQATQDEETAAIIAARERSEKQTRGIFVTEPGLKFKIKRVGQKRAESAHEPNVKDFPGRIRAIRLDRQSNDT
ncbi:hypothetical protein ON010_g12829 [Phytophthora cinnamomi]|nr:hypothetical protein ON010_g12829 [Phytophthora cinnamomi]